MANVVLPIAKLFFACSSVDFDAMGRQTIINPIARLLIPRGSPTNPRIDVFAMVIGAAGTFRFRVRCMRDGVVLGRWNLDKLVFGPNDRVEAFVVSTAITTLDFKVSGVYQFELQSNHAVIAEWQVPVLVQR